MILWVKTIIDKIVINGLEKKFNNFFLNEKISLADPEFITHGEFLINWKKKKSYVERHHTTLLEGPNKTFAINKRIVFIKILFFYIFISFWSNDVKNNF